MPTRPFTASRALLAVAALGWSDFVLKYRASVLGYLWSLALPTAKFGAILLVFGPYVRSGIPMYRLYLFLGILIWEHFSMTTMGCMQMLFEKSAIIQRMPFPRILLVFAVGWTNGIIFFSHLLVFSCYALVLGWRPDAHALYLLVTLAEMTMLSLGLGMLLASWCLKYRDIQHLWAMLLQILFWLTPIMFPFALTGSVTETLVAALSGPSSITELLKTALNLQPLSVILLDARRAVLYPEAWGMPMLPHTLGVLAVTGVIFALGVVVFQKRQASFLEEY